jgi:hypothetical protein
MFKSSTGLAAAMMVTGSFVSVMNLCKIKVFSGSEPATADAAETGTLLLTITNNSTATGLTWEAAATGRAALKKGSETWSGVVASSATAGYFRVVAAGDTGVLSTTEARLQGIVSNTASADLFFTNPAFTASETKSLAAFSVELPTN